MGKLVDLTGMRFGRLVVEKRVDNKYNQVFWHCKCDCGNEKDICGSSLKRGDTVSCGCYNREISSSRGDLKYKSFQTTNEYEFTVDTCIGYTSKGEIFLVDIEDFDLIKDISWHVTKAGYVVGNINVHVELYDIFPDWHNDIYLRECLYNLEEKFRAGGIPADEWQIIYDRFKDFTPLWRESNGL